VKISDSTNVAMPVKNMVGIIVAVAMGVFAYTEVTARLTSLETSRELFQADLLKKSEQKPTDLEQFLLLETVFKDVDKLIKNQEQNMTNKVNIEFLKEQVHKLQADVEKLIRKNGSSH
jgi:L-cysteine desulfidase